MHNWYTTQIDYVLAFPQAPIERDLCMVILIKFTIEGDNKEKWVLCIHQNAYGQKQAGQVWNKYLTQKLIEEVGFVQLKADKCVVYRGRLMYVLYTDDSILAGPSQKEID